MNFQSLAVHVRNGLSEASKAFDAYEPYLMMSDYDGLQLFHEAIFVTAAKSLFVRIVAALAALNLNESCLDFRSGFNELGDLSKISFTQDDSLVYSPAIEFCRDYVDVIEAAIGAQIDVGQTRERSRLENILAATAFVIREQNLNPSNESEVRRAMRVILKSVFPDTVSEMPISKVMKVYKPDFGVPSLRAAIEYKFCDSESEVGRAIGGIYEDVLGYAGSHEWEWFYAVFYLTDSFATPEHIAEDFRLGDVAKHWKPIVVVGRGGRKTRTVRSMTKRPSANRSSRKRKSSKAQ
jgi:hypothetical protein